MSELPLPLDGVRVCDFSWIVAMDRSNASGCEDAAPQDSSARIVCFMDYVPGAPSRDVPDPYYGGPSGFDIIFDLLSRGMGPLVDAMMSDR